MSSASFEKINYAFRPAKHAQRKMLCESLNRLARIAPLVEYRYVGFGSVGFHDFSLFHQRLGITDMTSIEGNARSQRRMSFNRPYSCIRMEWGWSYDVLPRLSWRKRSIVWLDYEHPLCEQMLQDVELMSTVLPSGSVLVITVPAEPEDDGANPSERLASLRRRVGVARVPLGLIGPQLSKWGLASVSRDIIHDEILRTLSDRNAPLEKRLRVSFRQLFNFQYADGKRMLTVGGILVDASDAKQLGSSFTGLAFVRTGKRPYRIEAPILTLRELRYLDSRLPVRTRQHLPAWIPAREAKRYSKLYRHFPNFAAVEA